jgi:hypothetical protein
MKKQVFRIKNVSKFNKIIRAFAIFFATTVLFVGAYMAFGHEDSGLQKWLSEVENTIETSLDK